MHGMWFTDETAYNDEHGYLSCSRCIEWFVAKSGIPASKWVKLASVKDYRKHSRSSWLPSHYRSFCLVKAFFVEGSKSSKSKSRKKPPRHDRQSESTPVATKTKRKAILTDAVWNSMSPVLVAIVKSQCELTARKYRINPEVSAQITSELTPASIRPHALFL